MPKEIVLEADLIWHRGIIRNVMGLQKTKEKEPWEHQQTSK